MSGEDDYLVTVMARDLADFERIHKEQLSRLPGVARLKSSFALRDVTNRPLPANLPVALRANDQALIPSTYLSNTVQTHCDRFAYRDEILQLLEDDSDNAGCGVLSVDAARATVIVFRDERRRRP